MEDLEYWIWFSRLQKFNAMFLYRLLEQFKSPKNLFYKSEEELIKQGIKEKQVKEIINEEYRVNLDKYIEYMNENNIDIITIYDNNYPIKLKEIYDPPVLLYVKGNKEILNEIGVAIIGCRECTSYGRSISKKLAYELALNNINIISGLARGIDTSSHLGALHAKGKTIAVVRVWIRQSVSKRK